MFVASAKGVSNLIPFFFPELIAFFLYANKLNFLKNYSLVKPCTFISYASGHAMNLQKNQYNF